jgi:DNA polymerase III sliding clamp (beta) subunit (PCNA family)
MELPQALIEDLAAKNDVRYYLNDPYLDKRGDTPMLVATNGHVLAAIPVKLHGDIEQGPIPTEAIKRCRKDQRTHAEKFLYFEAGRCGTGKVMFEREHMDCKFPQWTNLVPKIDTEKADYDICIDAAYMDLMQKSLCGGPRKKHASQGVEVYLARKGKTIDPRAAFLIKPAPKGEAGIIGVIMPMRGSD